MTVSALLSALFRSTALFLHAHKNRPLVCKIGGITFIAGHFFKASLIAKSFSPTGGGVRHESHGISHVAEIPAIVIPV